MQRSSRGGYFSGACEWPLSASLSGGQESNVKPRESSFLACAEVSVGFPMALISDAALMKILFCCSIHSLVCSWGNLMERAAKCGLMSWCLKTLSIANTSGRALCAPTIYTNNYNY